MFNAQREKLLHPFSSDIALAFCRCINHSECHETRVRIAYLSRQLIHGSEHVDKNATCWGGGGVSTERRTRPITLVFGSLSPRGMLGI